jgi:hypothetical protein
MEKEMYQEVELLVLVPDQIYAYVDVRGEGIIHIRTNSFPEGMVEVTSMFVKAEVEGGKEFVGTFEEFMSGDIPSANSLRQTDIGRYKNFLFTAGKIIAFCLEQKLKAEEKAEVKEEKEEVAGGSEESSKEEGGGVVITPDPSAATGSTDVGQQEVGEGKIEDSKK